MSLPLGECCLPGTLFLAQYSSSSNPCCRTDLLAQTVACRPSVPCQCANNITGVSGTTQAQSDGPQGIGIYADAVCCQWAGALFSLTTGCGGTMNHFAPICTHDGASRGNFKNCQLACRNSGYTSDGWAATCAASPSPPPPVSPPPTSPLPPTSPTYSPPAPPGAPPLSPGQKVITQMCCPHGSTYLAASNECKGPFIPATSNIMYVVPVTCACENRQPDFDGSNAKRIQADFMCNNARACTPGTLGCNPGNPNFGNHTNTSAVYDENGILTANRTVHDGYKVMCSLYAGNPDKAFQAGNFYDSWSQCMYACQQNGYVPDQWGEQCFQSPALPPPGAPPSPPSPSVPPHSAAAAPLTDRKRKTGNRFMILGTISYYTCISTDIHRVRWYN